MGSNPWLDGSLGGLLRSPGLAAQTVLDAYGPSIQRASSILGVGTPGDIGDPVGGSGEGDSPSLYPLPDPRPGPGPTGGEDSGVAGDGGFPGPDRRHGETVGVGDTSPLGSGEHGTKRPVGQSVPDIAGRDLHPQKRGGKDPTRDQLQDRLSRQQEPGSVDFEPVVFHAFVKAARIVPGGEVEIVLSVEPSQKYAALPITDAADFMVKITAERVVRDG